MFSRLILWGSYIFLLVVLLPHTSWMFARFEPVDMQGLGWAAAIAFEMTIGVLTHQLSKVIADIDASQPFLMRLKQELLSVPAIMLIGCIMISLLANYVHASTFANGLPSEHIAATLAFSIPFGAALPLASFGYAYSIGGLYKH